MRFLKLGLMVVIGTSVLLSFFSQLRFLTESEMFVSAWLDTESNSLKEGDILRVVVRGNQFVTKTGFFEQLILAKITDGRAIPLYSPGRPIQESPLNIESSLIESASGIDHVWAAPFVLYTRVYKPAAPNYVFIFETNLLRASPVFFVALLIALVSLSLVLLAGHLAATNEIKVVKDVAVAFSAGQVSPIKPGRQFGFRKESLQILEIAQANFEKSKNLEALVAHANGHTVLAQKVAHDIRSPLTALKVISGSLNILQNDHRRLLTLAVARIEEITNDLIARAHGDDRQYLTKYGYLNRRPGDHELPSVPVALLLSEIVSEKEFQYAFRSPVKIELEFCNGIEGAVRCFKPDISRALSNLIDNAIEACGQVEKAVKLRMQTNTNQMQVSVVDFGIGMTPEVLKSLGRGGFTRGKAGGSGLGLAQVYEAVGKSGGTVEVESTPGVGSRFTISFPKGPSPAWFRGLLKVPRGTLTVSVDEDPETHKLWRKKLLTVSEGLENNILHFQTLEDFENWFRDFGFSQRLILFIEFRFEGSVKNGLQTIANLGLHGHATLVTNMFDDAECRSLARKIGVKILPKCLLPYATIETTGAELNSEIDLYGWSPRHSYKSGVLAYRAVL